MEMHQVAFDGAILQRGFWVYVWRVRHKAGELLYVGRTGDSSSKYAASPFARLGQHLDIRSTATANMLLRQIWKRRLNPLSCRYSLVAIGPLFREQRSLRAHRPFRDRVASIETALAQQLRIDGHVVVGSHSSPRVVDAALYFARCEQRSRHQPASHAQLLFHCHDSEHSAFRIVRPTENISSTSRRSR